MSDNSVVISFFCFSLFTSLRSRRLEVVGERENGRVRGRHARLFLARRFFLVPTTSKLRRLPFYLQSVWIIVFAFSRI